MSIYDCVDEEEAENFRLYWKRRIGERKLKEQEAMRKKEGENEEEEVCDC